MKDQKAGEIQNFQSSVKVYEAYLMAAGTQSMHERKWETMVEKFEIVVRLRGIRSILSSYAHTEDLSEIIDMDYAFMLMAEELDKIINQLSESDDAPESQ